MRREGPRLEKIKHLEAEQRLRTYFDRLSQDPSYSYDGKQADLELIRRKRHEGREARVVSRGGGLS
jgi:hypothetical protein